MAEAPRLFLITPPITEAAAFAPLLEAAMEAVDVASLLLRSASADEPSLKAVVRALAPIAQASDVAVLIERDTRLAARLDVDGVHLDNVDGEAFEAALSTMKPRKIVGVGGLASRDAEMMAGERGADYLMFGGPHSGESHAAICDKVAWWAEIFNVPCIGYAHRPDLAGELAAAGAEFIGLCAGLWDEPATIGAKLKDVGRLIAPVAAR